MRRHHREGFLEDGEVGAPHDHNHEKERIGGAPCGSGRLRGGSRRMSHEDRKMHSSKKTTALLYGALWSGFRLREQSRMQGSNPCNGRRNRRPPNRFLKRTIRGVRQNRKNAPYRPESAILFHVKRVRRRAFRCCEGPPGWPGGRSRLRRLRGGWRCRARPLPEA